MRDNFTQLTKKILAERVGYKCSNPTCMQPTVGSHTHPSKSTIIGVAAHITAASIGGPRYDYEITETERVKITNGIWLCGNCASLIDKDASKFPIELLHEWKKIAENKASDALTKNVIPKTPLIDCIPFLELDIIDFSSSKDASLGLSRKNTQLFGNNAISDGEEIHVNIIHWYYSIAIYNNSSFPAFNLKIKEDSFYSSFVFESKLKRVNNIEALGNIEIEAKFSKRFEGTRDESFKEMRLEIPIQIDGKKILLEYLDEYRNTYTTEVIISKNGIVNKRI